MLHRPTVRSFQFVTSTGNQVTVLASPEGHSATISVRGIGSFVVNAETLVTLRLFLADHLRV